MRDAVLPCSGFGASPRSARSLFSLLDFVLQHYVTVGVEELDPEKLTPLLRLKYHAIADAVAELGQPAEISQAFAGFQKYLYVQPA